jgi:hypothetical protein
MTFLSVDGRKVRVTSRRQPESPWQIEMNSPSFTAETVHAFIFVDLTCKVPDFYVAPAQ